MANLCAHCASPAALSCIGCKECPSPDLESTTTTWYCGRECQKAHFATHKNACEDARHRKILVQVTQSIHDVLLFQRKLTVEFPLVGPVERKDGELHYHTDETKMETTYPNGISYPLPEPLWSTIDENAQLAILWKDMCCEALVYAEPLLAKMLKNIMHPDTETAAFSVVVEAPAFTTREIVHNAINPENFAWAAPTLHHTIGKIQLKSGEEYALDITGAQFGIFDIVMPWHKYLAKHVRPGESTQRNILDLRMVLECPTDPEELPLAKRQELINDGIDVAMEGFFEDNPAPGTKIHVAKDEDAYPTWLDKFNKEYKNWAVILIGKIDPISGVTDRTSLKTETERTLYDLLHEDYCSGDSIADIIGNSAGHRVAYHTSFEITHMVEDLEVDDE